MKEERSQYLEQEDRLLKYVKGRLTQEEHEEMEAALEDSPSLKKEARFIKNLTEVVKDPGWASSAELLLALKKEKLAELDGKTSTNKNIIHRFPHILKRNKLFLLFLLGIIASLLILTSNFFILADCSQLYNKYLTAYEDIITPGDGARPELIAGIQAYEEGQTDREQYAIALENFNKIKDKDPLFRFYTAVSGMLSPTVDIRQIRAEFALLRQEIEEDEEDNYGNLIDWIDYYEALLEFKQDKLKSGKAEIGEIAARTDLDYELGKVVGRFRYQLRFLYMAK